MVVISTFFQYSFGTMYCIWNNPRLENFWKTESILRNLVDLCKYAPKYAENLLITEDKIWGMRTLSQIVVRLCLGGKSYIYIYMIIYDIYGSAHLVAQWTRLYRHFGGPDGHSPSLMFAKPLESWITSGTVPVIALSWSLHQCPGGLQNLSCGPLLQRAGSYPGVHTMQPWRISVVSWTWWSLGSYHYYEAPDPACHNARREREGLDDSFDTSQHWQSKGRPLWTFCSDTVRMPYHRRNSL